MAVKTINFLPQIFQSDTNTKFLNATLDQLVSQPDLRKINAYVGRTFAPTFKSTDNYQPEPDVMRQNYQLEPSIVVKDKQGNTQFFSSYIDLIQQIGHYGGVTTDPSRMFQTETYSFDGLFDFDKFVNFNQYYWLPTGPDSVDVYGDSIEKTRTFTVIRDPITGSYKFDGLGSTQNPILHLAHGGTYKFNVNQPGYPFWIQSDPGITGYRPSQPKISTRDVLGVENNGTDVGTITFNVPQSNAQDTYLRMVLKGNVDLATTLHYKDIQNISLTDLTKLYGGIDGQTSNLLNKTLIFVNDDTDDAYWAARGRYDIDNYETAVERTLITDTVIGLNTIVVNQPENAANLVVGMYVSAGNSIESGTIIKSISGNIITLNKQLTTVIPSGTTINFSLVNYDTQGIVPVEQRRMIWRIKYIKINNNNLINLVPEVTVLANQKVYIKSGINNAQHSYYIDSATGLYKLIPHITAPLPVLFYQDGRTAAMQGEIGITTSTDKLIDIENKVIGKRTYISPNGVTFTNGLKVKFGSGVIPTSYIGKEYYVEGVGSSIKLLLVDDFISPEGFGNQQDYVTINRASSDLNPWTRSNRWFHIDVLNATANYNKSILLLDQLSRATRAIIEFDADIQLFNFGRQAKKPIDILDFTITDAFNQVELQEFFNLPHGIKLKDGQRIVFANDKDRLVRNKIYVVKYFYNYSKYVVGLTPAEDAEVLPYNNLIPLQGGVYTNSLVTGTEFYYDGANWLQCQKKTEINQQPLFDVINEQGYSLSDINYYPNSTFAGTKIFSYKIGTGKNDTILGFPLSYRNFNQIGDIEFTNNFDNEVFSYTNNNDVNINTVGLIRINKSLSDYTFRNMWIKNVEHSRQNQIIGGVYDGVNPFFEYDINPVEDDSSVPHFRVYRNSKLLSSNLYNRELLGIRKFVRVSDPDMVKGDRIDIQIYSNAISQLGYFEVPKNLDLNTENKNFTDLTLGQLRNHLITMANNTTQITGLVPGKSNLRDVPTKQQGGSIIQHASPVLYSELFLVDSKCNFMKGIELARHEYSKIKNKFLELSMQIEGVDYNDIPAATDLIIKTINQVKNKSFPWYYSDMVPYGDIKNTITYTVLDREIRDYEITEIFNDTVLSNRAVLVHVNKKILTKDRDFTYDKTRAGITINNTYPLEVGDIITINEYSDTDGNYIPETPTKLGLYPKFTPEKFIDDTYRIPISVIRGHDGSITPAFDDFRDDLLLEFETRIYNNIKVNYESNVFDLFDYVPGKFRQYDYNITDWTTLLTRSFLRWVGANRVDFTTNTYFQAEDPFTWNYVKFKDSINGEKLPGTWRAIFNYFYDTERPHQAPWEMLGFSEQPTWWEDRYGPAPYTGGNNILWDDLEAGYIHGGARAGYDLRFARPGLSKIIPVDDHGGLRNPREFAVAKFNSNDANTSYSVGNWGPVEAAWRYSSDYPYAVQQAIALAYPAFYFGSLMNVGDYYRHSNTGQFVLSSNLQRVTPATIVLNGDTTTGTVKRAAGYINWVSDYLRNNGIDPITKIRGYLDQVTVQLANKMAGYSDPTMLEVLADQSSPTSTNLGIVIPKENYSIELYKSTPTRTIIYSAVIIERSDNGYTISGYDLDNPYFTIITSLVNNNSYNITVGNDVSVIYRDYQQYKTNIPYGYEFNNKQQIVDFLISYERYLIGQGIQFSEFDTDLQDYRNFVLSAKEFLTWSQQGWASGSVLVLSPILNKLVIDTTQGIVDGIQNVSGGSRILDPNFTFIKSSQFTVVRDGTTFSLNANYNQTIALAVLDVVEYEHILIFDNTTVFNDIIYKPELGNRQYRLRLVGSKTGSWTGQLNPGGFIFNSAGIDEWKAGQDYRKGSLVNYKTLYYAALQDIVGSDTFVQSYWRQVSSNEIKTGLLPNFTYNAGKFNNFFDLDNPSLEGNFDEYSNRAIGFQERQYLTDFGIDRSTQTKFYQGFIREKGSKNAVNAFTAARFNRIPSTINMYEEWGIRVGEYGALENNKYIEVVLDEEKFTSDPATFTLTSVPGNNDQKIINIAPSELYRHSLNYQPNIYPNRDNLSIYENDILTAGYVNSNDVDITIFDIGQYSQLNSEIDKLTIGHKIWCAKDFNNEWNVYRVTETGALITSLTYNIDNTGTLITNKAHGLVYGDLVVIKDFDNRVDGVYQVYSIVNNVSVNIVITSIATILRNTQSITGTGPLYKLSSLRVASPVDLTSITPKYNWIDGDKLWVDDNNDSGSWAVYNKSTPWSANVSDLSTDMAMSANSYMTNSGFGSITTISDNGLFAAAGMPTFTDINGVPSAGRVMTFVANSATEFKYTITANLAPANLNISQFGASLESSGNVLYIGAPGNGSTQRGNVFVYTFNGTNQFNLTQQISSHWAQTGDKFGSSITASEDARWLFVGAPYSGNVEIYANVSGSYSYVTTISGSASANVGYTVVTTSDASQTIIGAPYETVNGVLSAGAVYVYDRSIETFISTNTTTYNTENPINVSTVRVTINGIDYTGNTTFGGSSITLAALPTLGSVINVETNKFNLIRKITADNPKSGAAYGTTAFISGNDADIFISSPGFSEPGYYSGVVYRYVNSGAAYGDVIGSNVQPIVTVGDTMRVNGQLITFGPNAVGSSVGNITSIVANISSKNIPGLTVSVTDYGTLQLTSNIITPYQRLVLTPGSTGNALANIGFNVYDPAQELRHPASDRVDQFGAHVTTSLDSSKLIISATGGTTYNSFILDNGLTIFDYNSTEFLDDIPGSGSVYIYGLVGGHFAGTADDQYVLVQRLQNNNLQTQDQFGSSIALSGNVLIVGASGDSGRKFTEDPESGLISVVPNTGTYYVYRNPTGNIGWDVIRSQEPKVDISSINKFYIYDTKTNTILTHLDHIDPAKGRVLGTAEEDIDYWTPYDPAMYNNATDAGSEVSISPEFHWGTDQVGKIWWNLDTVRFIDYEQGSLTYRAANWGSAFPGSEIAIYEWVESTVPPAQYIGDGTPLYADNTAYCIETYVDPVLKVVVNKYYFWVRGKQTINLRSPKKTSAAQIETLISNPRAQDIPFAAVVRSDTISLYGVNDYISGNTSILHIDYDQLKNTNIIHSEYVLVQEESPTIQIPKKIITKMKDSLAGKDQDGNLVPDPGLAIQNRVGIEFRPRQGMFVNRQAAVQNFVEYVNDILISVPTVGEYNLDKLKQSEPYPDISTYDRQVDTLLDLDYINTDGPEFSQRGYVVLVKNDESQKELWSLYQYGGSATPGWTRIRTQSYFVPFYWDYVDWYTADYDYTVNPTYVVNTSNDLLKFLAPAAGSTVKVLNNGRGQFEVYRFTGDGANRELVGIQNGTIQLSSDLYTIETPIYEFRIIFDAIRDDIFVKELQGQLNTLFFYMINYVITEQKNVDWIFKTSFISILHQLRKLEQIPNYSKDNQTYYESYINEVKPYRTSIREYLLDYQGDDTFEGDITDFDLPSIYNRTTKTYHSPDGSVTTDATQLKNYKVYDQWNKNHTLSISEVVVTNPGNGKVLPIASLNTVSNITVAIGDNISQKNNSIKGSVVEAVTDGNLITVTNIVGTFDLNSYIFVNAANTHTKLSAVTVLSDNGYFLEPKVTVLGGGGSGANIRAVVNYKNNTIESFDVINPGSNYTSTPTILINGVGSSAVGYPMMMGQYYTEQLPIYNLSLEFPLGNIGGNVYAGNLVIQPNTEASGTVYVSTNSNVITLVDVIGTFTAGDYLFTEFANLAIRPAVTTEYITLNGNVIAKVGDRISQPGTNANAIVIQNTTGKVVEVWHKFGNFDLASNINVGSANIFINNVDTLKTPIYFEEVDNPDVITSYVAIINKSYNKVRTFDQTLKFDRIGYTTQVIDWLPNITVPAGQLVRYNGGAFRALETVYSSAIIKLSSNISANVGELINQQIAGITTGTGTVVESITNKDVIKLANIANVFITSAANSTSNYGGLYKTSNVYTGAHPISITSIFDVTKYDSVQAGELANANDRIWAFYQPTETMLVRDLSKLVYGIEYPGVQVQGVKFDSLTSSTLCQGQVRTAIGSTPTGDTYDNITELVSANVSIINFVDLGFEKNQPLVITEANIKILDLQAQVLASAGDIVRQENSPVGTYANVEITAASNIMTVYDSVHAIDPTYGNLIVTRFLSTSANLTLANIPTVYSGQVISQLETGAQAIIEESSNNKNKIHVISITGGKFSPNGYAYLDGANTAIKFTAVQFDSITVNSNIGVVSVTDRKNKVIIQSVTDDTLLISGLQHVIDNQKTDVTLDYYNYNSPLYLDSIITSSYGKKYYELNLSGPVTVSYNSEIEQSPNTRGNLVPQSASSFHTTRLQVTGVDFDKSFNTVGNIIIDGIDSNVYPISVTTLYDTQSTLGVKPEDITVDGGKYYDTYSSHAPEELIPGYLRDNLNMVVTNNVYDMYLPSTSGIVAGNIIGQVGTTLKATCLRVLPDRVILSNIGGFDDRVTVTLDAPITVYRGNTMVVNTLFGYAGGNVYLASAGPVTVSTIQLEKFGFNIGNDTVSTITPGEKGLNLKLYNPTSGTFIAKANITGVTFANVTISGVTSKYQTLRVDRHPMKFRIEDTMNANSASSISEDWPSYYRYSFRETKLSQDLLITDANIFVVDASVLSTPAPDLARPGVIYINGEKISYYELDLSNNRIGRIRRAVDGTGAPNKHWMGNVVVANDDGMLLVSGSHKSAWQEMVGGVTNGLGLGGSISAQAINMYLNSSPIQIHYGDSQ